MKIFKIKRKWTPDEADEWSKEDWIAIILSPIAYILLMIGTAMSLLMMTEGFILLTLGIISTAIMLFIIDPKLSTISEDYEKKQKQYITELEKITRWED